MIPHRLTVVRAVQLLVAALLTVTVLPAWGLRIDLVLVVVVAVALRAGSTVGALAGLAAGVLVDVLPPGSTPLGLTALLYACVGAACGILQKSVRASVLLPVAAVALSAAFMQSIRLALAWLERVPLDVAGAAAAVLLTALLGAALVPPIVRLEHHLVDRGLA
ncbi:rod shape-determining protein MreD [Yimella sp. cx-51]|uniref:rod shape-determining protein MreD n=1 Tax=Yimella sp. cx-51 TaxID=2770551 RepID=UPI00165E8861|nr:rod shape-determining protein MreD [Yimella sp. cx-51]MBC9957154.1 rod shape-determining protein MreD [Yimella sp. cx-51]QTH37196.1 rod shape-determining protein MreD [Yimella sp. cx-51]